MKVTLTVSSRGLITLPAKLRKQLGIKPDDNLIAEVTSEGLVLRPSVTLPIEMYSDVRIREFDTGERALARLLNKKRPKR